MTQDPKTTKPAKKKTTWLKVLVLILLAFVVGILLLKGGPCDPPPPEPVPADCKPGDPCPVGQPADPIVLPETPGSGSSGSSTAVQSEDVSSSG